jgi:hypothetical protein
VGDYGDRDLKFFDAMLASLRKECRVDDKRIFVTGHSNGGGFTFLLWATRGEQIAAGGAKVRWRGSPLISEPGRQALTIVLERQWAARSLTIAAYVDGGGPLVACGEAPIRLYENRATLIVRGVKMWVSEAITSWSVAFATVPIGRVVGGVTESVSLRRYRTSSELFRDRL